MLTRIDTCLSLHKGQHSGWGGAMETTVGTQNNTGKEIRWTDGRESCLTFFASLETIVGNRPPSI